MTCGQIRIAMWLARGMEEPFLKFGLSRIGPDSLRQLLDVTVAFLEVMVMVQAMCVGVLMDFLLHVSKHVISGFLAIEIAHDEFVQCILPVGRGPVSLLREINIHSFFPCDFDVSAENLIEVVKGFGPSPILFLAGSFELCESVGEEEPDDIASRVWNDFRSTLLAVCPGLLKMDLVAMFLLIVPSFST